MEEAMLSVFVNLAFSLGAFVTADRAIRSQAMRSLFVKANLFGKDLNKTSEAKVPEGLGVLAGATFLITLFLFIPVPFLLTHLLNPNLSFEHDEFAHFLCALLSICCMISLGFADDVLNLRWRVKLLLPTIASLPLLMVYLVNGGSTTVILPQPVRFLLGDSLNVGLLYFIYMGMLAVFCTNAINILAGINGVEVGQSVVIGASIILFNIIELSGSWGNKHLFSLYLLLPFLAVSLALLKYNWYPSQVFVGDTFCYFAGMTFAVVAILSHFSKTMLLFFIPQIINFIYSVPQLFGLIPCPRHRLPRLDRKSGLLGISWVQFNPSDLPKLGQLTLFLFRKLKLVTVIQGEGDSKEEIRMNNLTVINFVLRLTGPTHEQTLTIYILLLQLACSGIAFFIRYGLVHFFYP